MALRSSLQLSQPTASLTQTGSQHSSHENPLPRSEQVGGSSEVWYQSLSLLGLNVHSRSGVELKYGY